MANKKWWQKLDPALYAYAKARCRAALAEPFAALSLVQHPWDSHHLELISSGFLRTVSLFSQLQKTVNVKSNLPDLRTLWLELEYPDLSTSVKWPVSEVTNAQSVLEQRSTCTVADGKGGTLEQPFVLRWGISKVNIPKECFDLIKEELEWQILPVAHVMAEPRDKRFELPPANESERLWDLRIRLSEFLRRFLSYYRVREPVRLPDPFVVFFLKPYSYDDHIPSGLVGYQYIIDPGQRRYLSQNDLTIEGEDLKLPFPNGMCANVFLGGRAITPHTIEDVIASYEDVVEASKIRNVELKILRQRTLMEIPVFGAGLNAVKPDGPELIATFAVPCGDKETPPPAESRFKLLESPAMSSFLPGESQIILETGQRLIAQFLRAPANLPTDEVIGQSQTMLEIKREYHRIARTNRRVILLGPSGSGKSLIAKIIHGLSSRKDQPFRRFGAANLDPVIALSELFGHVEGAFTGAIRSRIGILTVVHGGTLFLDDIEALDLSIQNKLRTFLDDGLYSRFGASDEEEIYSDVRIIAATNCDIDELIEAKVLKEDFVFRLRHKGDEIVLPPLHARKTDIPLLVQHFARISANEIGRSVPYIDANCLAVAKEIDWSQGEIRKLEDVVDHAVQYSADGILTSDVFLESISSTNRKWNGRKA